VSEFFTRARRNAALSASGGAATMTYNRADVPKPVPGNTTITSVLVIASSGTCAS
jgi:hypothetical protein